MIMIMLMFPVKIATIKGCASNVKWGNRKFLMPILY